MGNVVYLYDELHEQARSRSTSPTTTRGAKGSRWATAPQLSLPDPSTISTDIQTLPLASSSSPTPIQQPPKVDAPSLIQTFNPHERTGSSESATFIYAETDQSSDELSQETSLSSPHSARSGTDALSPMKKKLVSCQSSDQISIVAVAAPDVPAIEEDPWAAWDPNAGAGLRGSDAFARRQALTALSHAGHGTLACPAPRSAPPKKAAAASKWNAADPSSSVPLLQASEPSLLSRIAQSAPQNEFKSTHPTSPPTSGLGKIPPNPAASVGEEDGWTAWTTDPQAAKGGSDAHKRRQAMTTSKQAATALIPVASKPQKASVASPPPTPKASVPSPKAQAKQKAPSAPATAPKNKVKPPPVPYKSWKEYNATMSQALKTIRAARETAALALTGDPTPLTLPRKAKTLSNSSSPKKLPVSRSASDISTYTRTSEALGPSGFPEGSLLDQIAMGGSPRRPPSSSKTTGSSTSLVAMHSSQVAEQAQASLIDMTGFDVQATAPETVLQDSKPAASGALLELDGLCLGSPVPLADPTSPLSCFEDHDASMFHMPTAGNILVPSSRNGKDSNLSPSQASYESGHSSPSHFFDRSVSSSQSSAERPEQRSSSSRSSSRLTKLASLRTAVEALGIDPPQQEEVLQLLQALPRKDRATCVFNKEFLKAKVEEALYIMSIDSESTESEQEL